MSNDVTKTDELQIRDGFDEHDENDARLIQGSILKFNPDKGHWTCDGVPWHDADLIGVNRCKAGQRWESQRPIETILDFPPCGAEKHIEELNKAVPVTEWKPGPDGKPQAPYQLNYAVYALDLKSAAKYTIINSTIGMKVAYSRLTESVQLMRRIRGEHVYPIFKLHSAAMKTRFGIKQRPDFAIVDWTLLGPEQLPSSGEVKAIGAPVAPPTAAEIIDDQIPF